MRILFCEFFGGGDFFFVVLEEEDAAAAAAQCALRALEERFEPGTRAAHQQAAAVRAALRQRRALAARDAAQPPAPFLPAHSGAATRTPRSPAAFLAAELSRVALAVEQPHRPAAARARCRCLAQQRDAYRQLAAEGRELGGLRLLRVHEDEAGVVAALFALRLHSQENFRRGHRAAEQEARSGEFRAFAEQRARVENGMILRTPAAVVLLVHDYRREARERDEGRAGRPDYEAQLARERELPELPAPGGRLGPQRAAVARGGRQALPEGARHDGLGKKRERRRSIFERSAVPLPAFFIIRTVKAFGCELSAAFALRALRQLFFGKEFRRQQSLHREARAYEPRRAEPFYQLP